jgi:hypothetical protein
MKSNRIDHNIRESDAAVPTSELATMLLLASGLAGLVGMRRKLRKS